MAKNKFFDQLRKVDGIVTYDRDPFAHTLKVESPSLNWIYGKGYGLPFGYTEILFSPPKSGKSLICNMKIAGLHKSDPEANVLKFNTEYREGAQSDLEMWGIDPDRLIVRETNSPAEIFDFITNELAAANEQGANIKYIIIDSLQGIAGLKELNAATVEQHLMGDKALTLQRGFSQILPIIRRHNIAMTLTAHIRDNFEAGQYGPKTKMASNGWFMKHLAEYYIEIKRAGSAEDKKDLSGRAFEGDIKDFKGKKDITGHKIFVKMSESSVGVAGRTGQFTLDYNRGLINTHEEIFELSKNLGIVERPNNRTYIFDGESYSSKMEFANAIKDNEELRNKILKEIYK